MQNGIFLAAFMASFATMLWSQLRLAVLMQKHQTVKLADWGFLFTCAGISVILGGKLLPTIPVEIFDFCKPFAPAAALVALVTIALCHANIHKNVMVRHIPIPVFAISWSIAMTILTLASTFLPAT